MAMNDLYQKLGVAVKLWPIEDGPDASSDVEATEAWYNHETGRVNVQDRTVLTSELAGWLQQTSKPSNSGLETLVMRLVWVRVDPEKRHFNVSQSTREVLLKAFGLRLAYDYFQSFVTGVTKLPDEVTSNGLRETYAFSYAPKLAAIWSASHRPPPFRCSTLTQGLVFVRESARSSRSEQRVIQMLRQSLTHRWEPGLISHHLFPAYLIAFLLGIQIDHTQQDIKKKVQSLESRTGYHDFATRQEEAAMGFKQELSAKASGYSTKLASVERKSKTIHQLLTFISRRLSASEASDCLNPLDACVTAETKALLQSQIDALQYRHDGQVLDTQYIVKRVDIQIQALFHMIAQDDAFLNYKLSHHMAQIAEFSYRDAASMKTLAVVTMFFLPGSFVSALFSTQLFAWDNVDQHSNSIGVPTTPQLTLYWAVTIPLTVLTFTLYFLWLWYQKRERERNFKTDAQMDEVAATKGEGLQSGRRMHTFISEQTRLSQKV
ncbi:hypothetical protein NLU13_5706 [Sarocladium strictum]|uniref:Uncharacterized protein n=1 Tax=Sarocladium strictum TaxID=5046 RepID=A0AA39GES9_SARSR|nr:hypothetical protein NLU13_5824 [Sarocladium strictum]KAK0387394.1 hypothetical protein NLU13_5706 [Sarocladium strictum]